MLSTDYIENISGSSAAFRIMFGILPSALLLQYREVAAGRDYATWLRMDSGSQHLCNHPRLFSDSLIGRVDGGDFLHRHKGCVNYREPILIVKDCTLPWAAIG